jgi:hypothetical protein
MANSRNARQDAARRADPEASGWPSGGRSDAFEDGSAESPSDVAGVSSGHVHDVQSAGQPEIAAQTRSTMHAVRQPQAEDTGNNGDSHNSW